MSTVTGATRSTRTSAVLLAAALLSVELLAGMQVYLSETVLPLVAADLDGTSWYGVLNAAGQAAFFLTIPLGGWLLSRFRIQPLFLALTLVTVVGAVVGATAGSMAAFVAGDVLRSLAAGALATVSLGAISRGFPPRLRQLVLAGMSGVWVISSVAGPVYAASVASVLGWRWAMLLYLPLLILARAVIVRHLPPREEESGHEAAPWRWALLLATGALLLALPVGAWSALVIAVGAAALLRAAVALLPPGTLSGARGRPAALAALFAATGVYFGATLVLTVVAHDGYGMAAHEFAWLIGAPGFCWAVTGLWCGARPAEASAFGRRVLAGGLLIAGGVAALLTTTLMATTLVATTTDVVWGGILLGGSVAGAGMGMIYPALLGACFTPPEGGDGISEDHMASAVILAEAIGTTLVAAVTFSWLGTGLGTGVGMADRPWLLYAALAALAVPMVRLLQGAGARHATDLAR